MRELTKSMLSYTWAMSVFGAKQMAALLTPQSWGAAVSSFDAVSRCTEQQLGPAAGSTFRNGDSLQRGMVDLMFDFFRFGSLAPVRGTGGRAGAQCTAADTGWVAARGAPAAGSAAAASVRDTIGPLAGLGIELLQQGVNVAYQTMGAVTGQSRGPAGQSGWGPVPPPPS